MMGQALNVADAAASTDGARMARRGRDIAGRGAAGEVVAAFAAQVLGGLASTKRFEMLLMFLGGKEKKAVQRIFDGLRARQRPPPAALAASWGIK